MDKTKERAASMVSLDQNESTESDKTDKSPVNLASADGDEKLSENLTISDTADVHTELRDHYFRKAPRRVSTAPDFPSVRSLDKRKSSLSDLASFQEIQRRHSAFPAISSSSSSLPIKKPRRKGSAVSIGTRRRVSIKSIDKPPTAPDGGYGWVVVFAAFSLQVVFGGFLFSFGLYFVTFLEVFQEDRSTTAWIGSSLNGGFAFIAPLSSMLAKYFGCRKVIIMGQVLLAFCIFASTFSPNIYVLITLMGVFGGVGLGLVYLPTIVIVSQYFEFKRSLAIAICTAGTGIGGIFFPIIIERLMELYGWKGSLWIMSGFMIQCFTFAGLLRPLTESDMKVYMVKWQQKQKDLVILERVQMETGVNLAFDVDTPDNLSENNSMEDVFDIEVSIATGNKDLQNGSHLENGGHINYGEAIKNEESVTDQRSCIHKGWEAFTSYADVWLLQNPIFLLYTTSFTLATIGVRISSVFMPDYARVIGIPLEWVSFLLSITGIFNTTSKIAAGYISDKPWLDPLILYSVTIMVGGIVTMTLPQMKTYSHLIAFTVISGTNIGAISLLSSVNVVDLLGMEKMSGGLGLIMMIGGMAALLAVPFAGWLYDITGTYHATYYLSGSCSVLAGLLCLPLRHIARCIYGTDSQTI